MTTLAEAVSLPPAEAIAFLRRKVNVTTEHWTDVWNEAHSRAFMVAGAASDALVEDFRREVTRALEEGTTLADFRKSFDAIVERHGWQHTGKPGWRASIIYETNLATAYSAGRYAQQTRPEVLAAFPYWRYQHNAAVHPRLQHVAWNGLTLRADDPWWGTHYPPNGWRCHCTVRVVSERGLARMGKDGPDTAPPVDMRSWRNPKTGEIVQVPRGIDPGFGYNPGQAWKQRQGPVAVRAPARTVAEPARPAVATPSEIRTWAADPVGQIAVGELPDALAAAIGADSPEVRLSADTMEKQAHRHPEMTPEDYARLPEVLAAPDLVVGGATPRHSVFISPPGRQKKALSAVVKRVPNDAAYVVSFRRAGRKEIERLLRTGIILSAGRKERPEE